MIHFSKKLKAVKTNNQIIEKIKTITKTPKQ